MHEKELSIIELENVTIAFESNVVLKNVNFKVNCGDTIVIIGPSGSGKSVLLKTIAGIIIPTSGRVLFHGQDWLHMDHDTKHRLVANLGVQFQESALFDDLNVFDNVAFPIREHCPKISATELTAQVEECLNIVDLLPAKNKMPHELSGGMQHRLAIARALALDPEILLYDDPMAGLDPVNSDQMATLLSNLKKKKELNADCCD